MFEALTGVFGNSHFEAYIAGPVMGFIVACIFHGLGHPPPPESEDDLPEDSRRKLKATQKRRESVQVKEVHHHHYHGGGKGSQDDSSGLMVAAVVLAVATFLFAAFLPQIAGTMYFLISMVSVFSFTASLLAFFSGRFNTSEWWRLAIFPFVASICCFWLTVEAYQAITPNVVTYAQSLLGDKPMNIGVIIGCAIKFFTAIKSNYVQWIMFDMAAFMLILTCTLLSFFQSVHYVSLSNTRFYGSSSGWSMLALWTERFSGTGTVIVVSAFFVMGWFLATGRMYQLVH